MNSQRAFSMLNTPTIIDAERPNHQTCPTGINRRKTPATALRLLLRTPSRASSAFDSIKSLAMHLETQFHTNLAFVSYRTNQVDAEAIFVYDSEGLPLALERARHFRNVPPMDVAVAGESQPITWDKAVQKFGTHDQARAQGLPETRPLYLIPFSTPETTVLIGIRTTQGWVAVSEQISLITAHCMQFFAAHLRAFPPREKAARKILSPQEERVMQFCAWGLTDKETAKELRISPHTVRAHLNNAKEKLKAKNKTHAAILYATHIGTERLKETKQNLEKATA